MAKSISLFWMYGPLVPVPVWFIAYFVYRVKRHWKDGKDRTQPFTKHLLAKFILTALMVLFNCFHIPDVIPDEDTSSNQKFFRVVYYFLTSLAWLCSFFLVSFENKRRLVMKWCGHRAFWFLQMLVNLAVAFLQTLFLVGVFEEKHYNNGITKATTYYAGFLVTLILTCYAFVRPREFIAVDGNSLINQPQSRIIRVTSSLGKPYSFQEDIEIPQIRINTSIRDYKIKNENQKQVVYYNIIVSLYNSTHTVKRKYLDFDNIHKSLRRRFSQEEFPYLNFPAFPIFKSKSYPMEMRMKMLNDYLKEIVYPEFMTDELVEFLEIPSPSRESLLEEHKKFYEAERELDIQQEEIPSRHGSFVPTYYQPTTVDSSQSYSNSTNYHLQTFFHLRIPNWVQQENHVEYAISWKAIGFGTEGLVQRRFNNFFELHTSLKKALAPAKLPKFPSKNYLKNLRRMDPEAIELRRKGLEEYLSHVLNDPAFQCEKLLEFIGCSIPLDTIWESKTKTFKYMLFEPISWEGDVDQDGLFISYSMTFIKLFLGKKLGEWSIRRRYKEFSQLHNFLVKRLASPSLHRYQKKQQVRRASHYSPTEFPSLPSKTISAPTSAKEIEQRRKALENYIEGLVALPHVTNSYEFRAFIEDTESTSALFE